MHRSPKKSIRGVLTLDQYRAKSDEERKQLLADGWLLVPAGADGADDPEDGSKKKTKTGGGEDDDDEGDTVTVKRSEYDGLKGTVGTLRKEIRDLKQAREDEDDEAAKEAGKFEDLYKKERDKNQKLEAEKQDLTKGAQARAIAQRLNFHNPERASKMIDLDVLESEGDIEGALKDLTRSDPYLVGGRKKTSSRVGDDDPADDKGDDSKSGDKASGDGADKRSPTQKMADAYASSGAGNSAEGGAPAQE